jgi:hypothetical protein
VRRPGPRTTRWSPAGYRQNDRQNPSIVPAKAAITEIPHDRRQ